MINIREFRGSRPALHPNNQPLSYATEASNLWLRSGEFQPMRENSYVDYEYGIDASLSTKSIQIVRRNDGSYDYLHIPDISLAESVSINDVHERVYFGSETSDALKGFAFMLKLGSGYTSPTGYDLVSIGPLQPPERAAINVGPTQLSGEGDDTTVLYITYVLESGEESVPSIPTPAFGFNYGDEFTVMAIIDPLIVAQNPTLLYRVYMEVDGVARLVIETATAQMLVTGHTLITGVILTPDETTEEMATIDSYPPPEDGYKNVVNWHNGMLAAVSQDNRAVMISEPGNAFSWPREIPFARNIVRIIRSGDNLVVLTDGRPSIIIGGDPETAQEVDLDFDEPCASEYSVVDMGFGVVYCSHNGICVIANGSGYIATQDNRFDGGTAVIDPWEHEGRGVRASSFHGQYVYYSKNTDTSWSGHSYSFKYAELMNMPTIDGRYLFMVKNPDASLGQETLEFFTGDYDGQPMKIQRFQGGEARLRGNWTRRFELPKAEPLAYARVTAEDYSDVFLSVGDWSVQVKNDKPFPIKSTNRSRLATIGITGASTVQALQLGQAIEELY